MNLNGRDYVFSKAIGDAEWWSRGKKNKSRNSVTPSIQLTDTSISFHILWLDSFQETASESLRTLTNPKDCEGTVKPGCRQKYSTSLAGWETYRGRESLWTEHSSIFFSSSSRLLYLFPERIYILWKVSISHHTGVVDQGDVTSPVTGGQRSFIITQ